jgi:hypothetical protein
VAPAGAASGFTYFIPPDSLMENDIMTRGFMEAHMTVRSQCLPRSTRPRARCLVRASPRPHQVRAFVR